MLCTCMYQLQACIFYIHVVGNTMFQCDAVTAWLLTGGVGVWGYMKVGCFKAAMEAGSVHTSVPSIDCSSPSLTHTHTHTHTHHILHVSLQFHAVFTSILLKKSACAINEVLSQLSALGLQACSLTPKDLQMKVTLAARPFAFPSQNKSQGRIPGACSHLCPTVESPCWTTIDWHRYWLVARLGDHAHIRLCGRSHLSGWGHLCSVLLLLRDNCSRESRAFC